MLRKEKQISDRKEIDAVIAASQVCRLSMARGNEPYMVPLSFGYDGQAIYFHTAASGKKIDFLEANPRVCFEFEDQVQLIPHDDRPCKWAFAFKTVIGQGTVSELTDPAEKTLSLSHIMNHYAPKQWTFDDKAVARTRIWKITIQSIDGKRS